MKMCFYLRNKIFLFSISLICFLLGCSEDDVPTDEVKREFILIYENENLDGHTVFAECNPGGMLSCPCDDTDVNIRAFATYGEVTSNPSLRPLYVNAIGGRKFWEQLPDGTPLSLGVYRYSYEFALKNIPRPDPAQAQNGDAMHLMLQFWDGRSALWDNPDKISLEAAIYWELNPWKANFGHFLAYTTPAQGATQTVQLQQTGVQLTPDTAWHRLEMVVDLNAGHYLSLRLDDKAVDITHIPILRLPHPDWGTDISMSITTEAMALFPNDCNHAYRWAIRFRNVVLEKEK